MEKFYNIDEQRVWNEKSMWLEGGNEWSSSFITTENLWNKEIFDFIKDFRGKKTTRLAQLSYLQELGHVNNKMRISQN